MLPAEDYQRLGHLLRDTNGLTRHEKAFCRLILDRGGVLYATAARNAEDMGVSKGTYYRARDGVLAKGIVREKRRYKATTVYSLAERLLGTTLSTSRHSQDEEPKPSTSTTQTTTQVPPVASLPAEPNKEAPAMEMCEFHLSFPKDSCTYCARPKVESSLPEHKQKELYERDMAEDGLNEFGEPLGMDY